MFDEVAPKKVLLESNVLKYKSAYQKYEQLIKDFAVFLNSESYKLSFDLQGWLHFISPPPPPQRKVDFNIKTMKTVFLLCVRKELEFLQCYQ